ncbi:MAG: dTMP kinase, partial [Deltaproteobacteria bacterium]|nr:dTMP kinase [Deltaproteobacteria bacterium]
TNGPVGSMIKNILSRRIVMNSGEKGGELFDQKSVALLFAADRLDHIRNEIEPLLRKGFVVISDRYKYSSYAYQAIFAGKKWVSDINRFAIDPDFIVFLDVDVKTGLKRVGFRGNVKEIYEKAGLLNKVRKNYLSDLRKCRIAEIIDAGRTLDEVYLEVREKFFKRLIRYGYKIQVN